MKRFVGLRGTMASAASGALTVNSIGVAVRFALQVFYARVLGVVEYGRFVYSLNLAQLLAPGSSLGHGASLLVLVPEYEARSEWELLRGLLRRARVITASVGVITAALAAIALTLRPGAAVDVPLVVGVWLLPLVGLLLLNQEILRSMRRVVVAYAGVVLAQPLLGALGAILLFAATRSLSSIKALIALDLATVAVLWWQTRVIRRTLPSPELQAEPRTETRRWNRISLTLFMSTIFQRIVFQSDIVIVGAILGPREAALYAVASRIADTLALVYDSVNSIVAPTISRLHALGDRVRLQVVIDRGVAMTFWPSALGFVLLSGLGRTVLGLFGADYRHAWSVLVVLAAGNLFNTATGAVGYVLALTGNERALARLVGIHAVLSVALGCALVLAYGAVGAAVAASVVMISWNVSMAVFVRSRLGLRSYPTLRLSRLRMPPTDATETEAQP